MGSRGSSAAVASSGGSRGAGQEDQQEDVLMELRDVAKAFGNKTILSKASFKIRRGEAIGIIGALKEGAPAAQPARIRGAVDSGHQNPFGI